MTSTGPGAANDPKEEPRPVLDPTERSSEILFGLIMVLTFTGSLSAATSGRAEVRTMLLGALGCNLAWGVIDAVFYLMTTLGERGHNLLLFRRLRAARTLRSGHGLIVEALPPVIASILRPEELETMRQRLIALPEPPARASFHREDLAGALGVFLLVFLSTFPVVVPFLFMRDATQALRVSNGIAIALLFASGYSLGKYSGYRPWRIGLAVVFLGAALVSLTIALGG